MTRVRSARGPRRSIAGVLAGLLLAVLLPVLGTAAPASAASTFTSTAVNRGSGDCMDDPNSSTSTGVQLIQYSCSSGSNQNWTFTPVSGTSATYTITTFAGLCVDVSGRSTADNTKIIQWTCNQQTNQQWTLQPVSISGVGNTFNLVSVNSGKCIVPTGDSTANDVVLVQLPCTSATTRVWQLPSANSGGGTGDTVTVTSPGSQTSTVGTAVSLQVSGSDSVSGQTLTYSASGLPAGLSISSSGLISGTPTTAAGYTPTVTATDTTGAAGSVSFSWTVNSSGVSSYQGIPAVAPNACNNSSLPNAYGTNFPTPTDPYGQGYYNESALGWDGNYWPVFSYLSGSYFARGVPTTYNAGGTTICGAMYSFSIYQTGGSRPAQSVQWSEDSGYLPALTTSFTSGTTAVSIKDFADKVTISGNPFMLVYTRVSVTDNGSSAITLDPGGSGTNLVRLTSTSLNTVQPGATSNHDYVAAVDDFGSGVALPSAATLASSAPTLDSAYSAMSSYWNGRIAETATISLPNLTLPNTGNLANPGTALVNAYKAGTIYNLIMQVGEAQFSAADNYAWLLNHDVPGELMARFETGDFHDAQNLLLTARISENPSFNEEGANWYYDGDWKTPAVWALYLAKTNDTAFVSQYFHDDSVGSSPWGPSLYTIMHSIYQGQLASDGVLAASYDNDSSGRWLFDDYSALQGLAAYKYIATRLGNTAEAQYADTAYTSLLNNLNTLLGNNESANGFSYLPCTVDQPNSANRCNTYNDANWASPEWTGQDQWSTMLEGGTLNGIAGSAAQGDALYAWGFNRLSANGLPYPTFGAFDGYSTAYNTAYSINGLYGTQYRDLPITSYAWQLATTTGGPNAWWEANGSGPDSGNPWIGNHAGPEFGACPYAWPTSAQQQGLLESLVAQGLSATGTGPFTYTSPLYLGRGIPNTWITAGQTISVSNLTSAYSVSSGSRSTYGVSLAVTKPGTGRVITVTLSGTLPGGSIAVQLPIFNSVAVSSVTGGTYDSTAHSVTVNSGTTTVTITLAS
ncbi:RICIN domain-containing protein [Actinospica durhamensis]|uniref:RICIN domain-containing protein n=1 Tax=Actinospica durhamensis TaxID=1508375 RepID=A0A941ESM1_9ACTN|nr:RICIN domain-containing protein [Actinospica durhamensis]MBR7835717.1 RICIN domain-containing protein [Actinospica durhamensis]